MTKECLYCGARGVRLSQVTIGTYIVLLCANCNKQRRKKAK